MDNERSSLHLSQKQQQKQQRRAEAPSGFAAERYRRQELAGTAFWALIHQNQRAKSYLRGALKEEPSVTLEDLTEQVKSVEHLTSLPGYREQMRHVISGLQSSGLATA